MSASPAAPPGRIRGLVAAISCIAVFGAGIGFSMPLLALILEARGYGSTLIGLNGAASFLGVIVAAPLVPWATRACGAKPLMIGCLIVGLLLFAMILATANIAAWFVLRFAMGVVGSGLFTASEAWIGSLAGDRDRGRIMGLYAAVLSAALCAGPLLLPLTGIAGWRPLVANAALVVLAALPLLATPVRFAVAEGAAPLRLGALRQAVPAVLPAVAFYGLFEGSTLALLPVWGLRVGFSVDLAAATLSAVYLGGIVLQVPMGWLSDYFSRLAVLRLCGVATLAGALLLPLMAGSPVANFALLFLWGGFAGALYPVALSMAGDRFRGSQLLAANAAVVMCYGFGSLAGPALGGAAMSLVDPHGLMLCVALAVAVFLPATFLGARAVEPEGPRASPLR